MDTLELLGVALGLATLAGINLYLTVFVAGMSLHFHWVALPAHLGSLQVLESPWIWGVAGVLYLLEFFADKVPWVDSLNDSIHTAIRPVGGALLGVLALGQSDPVIQVVAALLAGGAAMTAHLTKSGVRLIANASPEPVSNVALSVGEDVVVLGSLALLFTHPIVLGVLAIVFLGLVWTILPSLWRATRSTAWLAWRKLKAPATEDTKHLPRLPEHCEESLRRANISTAPIRSAYPVLSMGGKRVPKHSHGWLVLLAGERTAAFFIAPRLFQSPGVIEIAIQGAEFERRSRFLSETLSISSEKTADAVFAFERGQKRLADQAQADLKDLTTFSEVVVEPPPSRLIKDTSHESRQQELLVQ